MVVTVIDDVMAWRVTLRLDVREVKMVPDLSGRWRQSACTCEREKRERGAREREREREREWGSLEEEEGWVPKMFVFCVFVSVVLSKILAS